MKLKVKKLVRILKNPNEKWLLIEYNTDSEKEELIKYKPLFITPNAITLTDSIQIVIRFYGNPDKIHKNYDFVHATNWFSYKDYHLELRKEALVSLITKELRYIGSRYPITSIIRSKKFIQRGFTINAGEYLKILFQVSELDLKDYCVLEDQLIGVDVAYFSILVNALQNISKENMNYPYIVTIIDKIFNE